MPFNTPIETFVAQLPDIAHLTAGAAMLSNMLAEDSPHFAGLSVEETEWARAHIYAAMALSAHPQAGLRAAREDLATSDNPFVLAGVARLLRAANVGPSWNTALTQAKRRIEFSDIFPDFRFDPPSSPCCGRRTCIGEIDAAFVGGEAARAATYTPALEDAPERLPPPSAAMLEACLQDQSGVVFRLKAALKLKPILLALFYTRCMNPQKCSLTISRLGNCARTTSDLGVLGMSYDPAYDTPSRLLTYGADRNFPFSKTARIVRSQDSWDVIKEALHLRAGYGAATINAHAREVFLIPQRGDIWRLPPDWLTDVEQIADFVALLPDIETQTEGCARAG